MKPLIVLLVGPPGSGKSTVASKFDSNDFVRISQDDQGKEHLPLFHRSINEGKNLIIDRMNFDLKQRNRYLDVARNAGYETRIEVLHVPMQVCMDRCRARKDHPTITTEEDVQNAVTFFFRKYERVEDSEADWVDRCGWVDEKAVKCVVSDLDGTLANIDHRLQHVRAEKRKDRNWMKFFDEMVNDTVNNWCSELIHQVSEKYLIVYATGRPGDYEDLTRNWLESNNLNIHGSHLFMRQKKDHRRDDIVKQIILDFEIKPRYNILFVVDDRLQVVEMWRKNGETVLQCAKGDF